MTFLPYRLCLAASCLLLSACGASISQDWQTQVMACPSSDELGQFMPWDRLEIRVYGQEDLSGEYEVSPKGTISFPQLGELYVQGKRCDELESLIRNGLMQTLLRDPSVVCINKDLSKTAVTVDGQVQKPGIVDFRPGLMLTDVIAQSGGPTPRAQSKAVVIVRKQASQSISITVPYQEILQGKAPNVCMHPADLIYVPLSAF